MEGKKENWSKPDYEGWQDVAATVTRLPPNRFYFVVTLLVTAFIAWLVSESVWALSAVVALMLTFSLCVLLTHRRNEGDGQETENRSVESTDDTRAAGETRKVDGGLGLGKHDGHSPSSPSGLRTPLESQEKEAATNRPR